MNHFQSGLDRFNRQEYFAAHEEWEADWNAAGRKGAEADFLKALIHLAAAGVKFQQGTPAGVRSHATRAAELLRQVAGTTCIHGGLDLQKLADLAESIARDGWPGMPPRLD